MSGVANALAGDLALETYYPGGLLASLSARGARPSDADISRFIEEVGSPLR